MMNVINTIFLSGWFQLVLLVTFFIVYSHRVLSRELMRGYALGWMIGLFFIFSYLALNPLRAFYLSAYDYELNIFQVFLASVVGILIGGFMVAMSVVFRNSHIQQSLNTAAISGVFAIAIFTQLIATPDARLMVSLFILAFGMCILTAHILLMRRDEHPTLAYEADYPDAEQDNPRYQGRSRLDRIRQRITQRGNRPTATNNY